MKSLLNIKISRKGWHFKRHDALISTFLLPKGLKFCLQVRLSYLFLLFFIVNSERAFAQQGSEQASSIKLKMMSLEELMNLEVTSVSMRPEKLSEVPSAIQMITNKDVHRSGAVRITDALRLAPNLQMTQVNSHDWSVTSRGFSGLPTSGGVLSNKLLVMVDGRSVYSPLFGGVYWDVQNIMLEDLDRIEVVSGPGGTLWGANAVNGIINIVRKSSKETQGIYASGIGGSYLQDLAEIRYGSKIDSNLYFRVYGQRYDQQGRRAPVDTVNAWRFNQGGFRMDYYPTNSNTITVQGDFYAGDEKKESKYAVTEGQNVLSRFTHRFSEQSDVKVQFYFDRTNRETPNAKNPFNYELRTYDLDLQYRFPVLKRQSVLIGGGWRYMEDKTNTVSISPKSRSMPLYTFFFQDEIAWIQNVLKLTVGSKFQHNVFTGIEIQPSARLAFTPGKKNTIWAAVSRAVRTPSRFDSDIVTAQGVKLTPVNFKSEKTIVYELGYRLRPVEKVSISIASYYNQYTDLRSLNSSSIPTTPTIIANDQAANSWGIELSGNYQVMKWWRLRGGYSYFKKEIFATNATVLPLSADFEGVDPESQVSLQSTMDLPKNISLDFVGRFVEKLNSSKPNPVTPEYFSLDARIAWNFKQFEISVVGQNLLQDEHYETGLNTIPRSIYGKLMVQF